MNILGDPGAVSRDDAIFSGERYFRAKVYFKSRQAPGHLFLPNQYHRCSNSVPLIGQKNLFLANRRGDPARRHFLHEVVFLIDRGRYLAREDSRGEFQKKRFNEAKEITSCNMSVTEQYWPINFHGGLIEGIS